MCDLFQLVYVSSASPLFTESDLLNLLKESRKKNLKHDLTGMLLYHEGNIMQVIEGKENEVFELFGKIQSDKRHTGLIKLLYEPIERRNFKDWSMSYLNITDVYGPGFSQFMREGLFSQKSLEKEDKVKELLFEFRLLLRNIRQP